MSDVDAKSFRQEQASRLDFQDTRSTEEGKKDDMEKKLNLSELDDTTRTNSLGQMNSKRSLNKESQVPIKGKW